VLLSMPGVILEATNRMQTLAFCQAVPAATVAFTSEREQWVTKRDNASGIMHESGSQSDILPACAVQWGPVGRV
jgi:hypothetical protein